MAVSDILMGPVTVWIAAAGTALPDENAVGVGQAWGGAWAQFGYTKEGNNVTLNYDWTETVARIHEAMTAVRKRKTAETLAAEFVLAEFNGANLQRAMDGTLTTTPPGPAQVGKEEIVVGGDPVLTEYALGFEGVHVSDAGTEFPMRVVVHKATLKINGNLEFGKAVDGTGIPVRVDALEDMSKPKGQRLLKIQRVTAPHT